MIKKFWLHTHDGRTSAQNFTNKLLRECCEYSVSYTEKQIIVDYLPPTQDYSNTAILTEGDPAVSQEYLDSLPYIEL
jgi:hypothetical protein